MKQPPFPFSLRDYITPVRSRIPPELINSASLDEIEQFAASIPGAVSAFFGFECPLGPDLDGLGRNADLLFCSTQLEGHTKILAGNHRSISLPSTLSSSPEWQKVQQFCQYWEDPSSPLNQQLLNIWLEFDIGQSNPPYAPSLFFGTQPASHHDVHSLAETVFCALANLSPDAIAGRRGETLRRIILNPPDSETHVFQVGVMLAREMPAIRICLRGLKPGQISATLAQWGWQEPAERLNGTIGKFETMASRIDLDIDVGEQIGSKIGLECSFGQDAQTVAQMRSFLQALVEEGLTSTRQADAMLGYNGLVHQDTDTQLWHEHLLRMAALQGKDVINYLSCWLNHIKLVVDADKPLSAKAYLAVLAEREKRQALRDRLANARLLPLSPNP